MTETFYVDLPNPYNLGEENAWINIADFETKEEAIAYIREYIDPNCDEEGRINLIIH